MHPSGLTTEQITKIQDMWANRVTIASLARVFSISEEMVRKIISAPRKEV